MNGSSRQQEWMLQVLSGPSSNREFELDVNQSYTIGRREHTGDWQPDLDLFPDTSVSRRHAQLTFVRGSWQIEDCGSKAGTRVDGREIQVAPNPTTIVPGMPVQMGDTIWILSPSDICRTMWHDVRVEIRLVPVITYSLYHCNIPVISQVRLKNTSANSVGPLRLAFCIPGYSYPSEVISEKILGEETRELGSVPIRLHYEKLEGQVGRKRVHVEVKIDDQPVLIQEVEILGFYEWPIHSAYRKSLACFVQPTHPLVTAVVSEATRYLEEEHLPPSFTHLLRSDHEDTMQVILRSLYLVLRDHYDLRYVPAEAGSDPKSQSIRPPHRIITNHKARRGEGTCIDLALFVASALESVTLQPLVVLLSNHNHSYHALVGCWGTISARVEPVISTYDRLNRELQRGGIIFLEPTGFTDRFIDERGRKLAFEEAVTEASALVTRDSFVFALDVAAARQTVTPLQMPMEPAALQVVRAAERLARDEGSERLETKHLLASLIAEGRKDIGFVLEKAGADTTLLRRVSTDAGGGIDNVPVPTLNYRRCLEDARIAAADSRVTFVGQEHLLFAVLQSQSANVERLWGTMGTDRQSAIQAFNNHFLWTANLVETHYE
jgi:hypothetical protein